VQSAKIQSLPYRPCAGVVLINRAGLVFGGQRIDNPGTAWQMPQGGLDYGELPEEAALRELTEETGVTRDKVEVLGQTRDWITYELPEDLLGKLWKGKYRGQEQMWFAMRFLGDDADINIATETAEFSRWQWMTPEALVEAIVPFKRDVYEAVFADLGVWVVPS
jgi:putative (di)nucleoside polyphosphate hydrolase